MTDLYFPYNEEYKLFHRFSRFSQKLYIQITILIDFAHEQY